MSVKMLPLLVLLTLSVPPPKGGRDKTFFCSTVWGSLTLRMGEVTPDLISTGSFWSVSVGFGWGLEVDAVVEMFSLGLLVCGCAAAKDVSEFWEFVRESIGFRFSVELDVVKFFSAS